MAFHDIQFPPGIAMGAVGGPGFHTTILTLASGSEQRNIDWSKTRGAWDVAHGLKTQEELNVLLEFFYARRGRAYGFRFKDWTDFRNPFWRRTPGDVDPLPVLFVTDGVTTQFRASKAYIDAGGSYVRTIYKLVQGTLTLKNNGVAMTVPTHFNYDANSGLIVLASSVYTTTGHQISGSFEFDVPVRFDTDQMKVTLAEYNNYSWGQIPLVELRLAAEDLP